MAMIMARIVTTTEIVLAMARLPVEKIAPIRGVMRVAPQVGQPAPRAIRPVMMPAFWRFSAFCSRFLSQRRMMMPIKIPCKIEMKKMGSQSRKG